MPDSHPLAAYRDKRRFDLTPEPEATLAATAGNSFVIQKHWASHLHYDFRLELDGTMKSWAVPKGPSLDPKVKRMAVQVEDHPVAYNTFEGEIPAKQYGAGKVIIWDRGTWEAVGDPAAGYRDGNLKFILRGEKLQGKWALIRMKGKGEKQAPWLLIKEKDAFVRKAEEYDVLEALPDSVAGSRLASPDVSGGPATEAVAASVSQPTATGARTRAALDRSAVAGPLPPTLTPQLATLADAVPGATADWRFEIKFDGYRLLARIEGDQVKLFTRNGNDWSAKMPELVSALRAMALQSAWLDGEIVVLDAAGMPDFQALQAAFDGASSQAIVFYLFDAPFLAGQDLRSLPLELRQRRLAEALDGKLSDRVRLSEVFEQSSGDLLASACNLGLEGIIGKRRGSTYSGRRSNDWIKIKCKNRQEFVIVGFTPGAGARAGFGALLLGVHDKEGTLQFAGKVGTGFDDRSLKHLTGQLAKITVDAAPIDPPADIDRDAKWVEPKLMAEVSFAAWTDSGRLRHAVFHALRSDKSATEIVREQPGAAATTRPAAAAPPRTTMRITHPEKIIDATTGLTKGDLVDYYAKVGTLMMPHLFHRPVALVRAPDGIGGALFFQKHADQKAMAAVVLLDPALDPGHAPLLTVSEPAGLLSAAQLNVIEFHTWNGRTEDLAKPERMAFDLDPGEGVAWPVVQESAVLLNQLLDQLGLYAFLKTSGGKGLHLVVPLARAHDWTTVKAFSHAIVEHLARTLPTRFVAKSGPDNRIGKVYVDYLRNGFGATTASAWSARARPGLGVSVPIRWDELAHVSGGAHWSVQDIDARIGAGNAAWTGYDQSAQSLDAAMATLGFDPARRQK